MKFAKEIGAEYISTGTAPKIKKALFIRNLKILENKARDIGITICLETEPGEVIENGREVNNFFKTFDSPYIKTTYDFGNAFYASKGKIKFTEDLLYIV